MSAKVIGFRQPISEARKGFLFRVGFSTGATNRKTLLIHGTGKDNGMLSLEEFNALLTTFTSKRLVAVPRYSVRMVCAYHAHKNFLPYQMKDNRNP